MERVRVIGVVCVTQCVVLPMSVVIKCVQSNTMVYGSLAMLVCRIDELYTQALLNIKPSL